MRIFISGGCKNGKSYYAQRLAAAREARPLYYIATMRPVDEEDDERIERHRREREGWGFTTVEQPADLEAILRTCDRNGSFLLDSVTALLANEMFGADASRCFPYNAKAAEKVKNGLIQVIDAIENIVIVSDYIYSDALPYDALTENYRKALATVDRAAAARGDAVLEVAYGNVIVHKGGEQLDALLGRVNKEHEREGRE